MSLFPDADLTVTEASSSDSRAERAELYAHVDEGLLGGEASFLGPPLTPEKDEALHQATAVASLRAALMSKNSLLSLKADMLGEDGSLLFEYLPKGTHSLSCKCRPCVSVAGCRVSRGVCSPSAWWGGCGQQPLPRSSRLLAMSRAHPAGTEAGLICRWAAREEECAVRRREGTVGACGTVSCSNLRHLVNHLNPKAR